MFGVIFDEQGKPWDVAGDALRRNLGVIKADYDLAAFLVRNAGWVAILLKPTLLTLILRPRIVSPKALAAALYWVSDHEVALIRVAALTDEHVEVREANDRFAAVGMIARMVSAAAIQPTNRFARRDDTAINQPTDGISDLAAIWSELCGRFDIERLWRVLTNRLKGRYILVEQVTNSSSFQLLSMGTGFLELSHYWRNTPNIRIDDQPDYEYGRWTATAYRQAAAQDAPLIERVDCDIQWPREGLQRHRYRRIIAPFRRACGQLVLVGVTIPDHSVSLR